MENSEPGVRLSTRTFQSLHLRKVTASRTVSKKTATTGSDDRQRNNGRPDKNGLLAGQVGKRDSSENGLATLELNDRGGTETTYDPDLRQDRMLFRGEKQTAGARDTVEIFSGRLMALCSRQAR